MVSRYLSPESCAAREDALIQRLANEVISIDGCMTWPPESDGWKVPEAMQRKAFELATKDVAVPSEIAFF